MRPGEVGLNASAALGRFEGQNLPVLGFFLDEVPHITDSLSSAVIEASCSRDLLGSAV